MRVVSFVVVVRAGFVVFPQPTVAKTEITISPAWSVARNRAHHVCPIKIGGPFGTEAATVSFHQGDSSPDEGFKYSSIRSGVTFSPHVQR